MAISEPDIKRLWAKSAGRCSFPGCNESCVLLLEQAGYTIIGEMAHVIARSETGPRGKLGDPGPDTYENLVLLCPTHHTLVDKAPADFPEHELRKWKFAHERRVEKSLRSPSFDSRVQLYDYVKKILAENRMIHRRFGPDSLQALANPLSEGATLWDLRKTAAIVPNNRRIINACEQHSDLLSEHHWNVFLEFREHALAFEKNTYQRMDRNFVPRFPTEFETVVCE